MSHRGDIKDVVDAHKLDKRVVYRLSQYYPADPAKTVDTYFYR